MASIRAFEDFCSNVVQKKGDIVTGCFPGLTLRSFLDKVDRNDINKRALHITLTALEDFEGHNYPLYLEKALPAAMDFCRYAESQVSGDLVKVEKFRATGLNCDFILKDYVLSPQTK
ncbi:MAG: hypothetical protein ABI615_08120 [Chthoniobacterales bacterium]